MRLRGERLARRVERCVGPARGNPRGGAGEDRVDVVRCLAPVGDGPHDEARPATRVAHWVELFQRPELCLASTPTDELDAAAALRLVRENRERAKARSVLDRALAPDRATPSSRLTR